MEVKFSIYLNKRVFVMDSFNDMHAVIVEWKWSGFFTLLFLFCFIILNLVRV